MRKKTFDRITSYSMWCVEAIVTFNLRDYSTAPSTFNIDVQNFADY